MLLRARQSRFSSKECWAHIRHKCSGNSRCYTTPMQIRQLASHNASAFPRRLRYLLVAMPVIAFSLGTWQIQRRQKKLIMIEDMAQKLAMEPLVSLDQVRKMISPSETAGESVPVRLGGHFRHDKEMLVGPRQNLGETGYFVVTPFVSDGEAILVNRGWIAKRFGAQQTRKGHLQNVSVSGLLRRSPPQNMFTPANNYSQSQFYYIDVDEMGRYTGTLPILLEETIGAYCNVEENAKRGIPIGKAHEVVLPNNHMQYIVTWYSLAIATGLMSISLFSKQMRKTKIR